MIELSSVAEETPFLDLVRTCTSRELALIHYDAAAGEHQCIDSVPWKDKVILPPEEDEFTQHVIWPTHIAKKRAIPRRILLKWIDQFLDVCIDIEERHRFLLACFVLSTWSIDVLRVAPYIALVGLPQSGKSTALKILQLICRRGMITSDISSAAFYRACERLRPTLFIDEAATASQRKALFHLLRSGSTRDSVVFRAGESYRTFGAKVMSFRQLPDDDALNSRCVVIPMRESSDIRRRPTDKDVLDGAANLRAILLRNRFEYLSPTCKIRGVQQLRSRSRDLYESLVYSIGDDLELATRLLGYFADAQQSSREPLLPREMAVVETLFEQIHLHPDQANYPLKQLTQEINLNLSKSGERLRLNPKAVGAILHTLGFRDRNRTAAGFVVWLERRALERIHDLMWTYGLDAPSAHLPEQALSPPCEFCTSGPSRNKNEFEEEETHWDDTEDTPNQPLSLEDVLSDEQLCECRIGEYAELDPDDELEQDQQAQSPGVNLPQLNEGTGGVGNGASSMGASPVNGGNGTAAEHPSSDDAVAKPPKGKEGEFSGTSGTLPTLGAGSVKESQDDLDLEIGPGYSRGWIENAADQKLVDELRRKNLRGFYPSDEDESATDENEEDSNEEEDDEPDDEDGSDESE